MVKISRGNIDSIRALYELTKNKQNVVGRVTEYNIQSKFPNCPNCGAPLTSSTCEYCGSEWVINGIVYEPKKYETKNESRQEFGYDALCVWLEAHGKLQDNLDIDLFAVVDYGTHVKLICYATNDCVLGVVKGCTTENVLDKLLVYPKRITPDVKSVTLYAKAYGDINFGIYDNIKARLQGFNFVDMAVTLDEQFALENCVKLCTLSNDKVSFDLDACNFDKEVGERVREIA